MESVSLIDNVLFSMDTFLDHFSDTRRRESRIAFPPSVDWTRCNDELRNRVVGAIVVDGQVVLDRGVAGASATRVRTRQRSLCRPVERLSYKARLWG